MKKKGIKLLMLGIISIFACLTIVYALPPTGIGFVFDNIGEYVETTNTLNAGKQKIVASLYQSGDATLGLSLSKSTIFGWIFISRCNPSILNKTQVSCTWANQSSGLKKGSSRKTIYYN